MITVDVIYAENKKRGFVVSGHAEYAEPGMDIVCAGVSTLVFTTINSLDEFLSFKMNVSVDEDEGVISCIFEEELDEKSSLLINSMLYGLRDIQLNYGEQFLRVNDQEVIKWLS